MADDTKSYLSALNYRFDDLVVDVARAQVLRAGVPIALPGLSFDLLLALVRAAPNLVTYDELMKQVWPGLVVNPETVTQRVKLVRDALGDDPRSPRYIAGVRGRGYRLRGEVHVEAPEAADDTRSAGETSNGNLIVRPLEVNGAARSLRTQARLISADLVSELVKAGVPVVVLEDDQTRSIAQYSLSGTVSPMLDGKTRVVLRLVDEKSKRVFWCTELNHGPHDPEFSSAAFAAYAVECQLRSCATDIDARPSRDPLSRALEEWYRICLNDSGTYLTMVNLLEQAVRLDPRSIWGHIMLAVAFANRMGGRLRACESWPMAHAYTRRLLEIDPDETYMLGQINHSLDLDYASAIVNLEHARRCRWGAGLAGFVDEQVGFACYISGRREEAIEHLRSACATGAHNDQAFAHGNLACVLMDAGRLREAKVHLDRAQSLCRRPTCDLLLTRVDLQLLRHERADAERTFGEAWSTFGEKGQHRFARGLAEFGSDDRARQILRESESLWNTSRLAVAHTSFFGYRALGDLDAAWPWLERAIDNRETALIRALRCNPGLDDVRGDRRWNSAWLRLQAIESIGSPTRSIAMERAAAAGIAT